MRSKVVLVPLLLTACASSQPQRDVPAVLSEPSAEVRAELRAAVSAALNVGDVRLADDALTSSNTLTVERDRPRDATGRQLSGRDFGRPERFLLVKNGSHCVLLHETTGNRIELAKAQCQPA